MFFSSKLLTFFILLLQQFVKQVLCANPSSPKVNRPRAKPLTSKAQRDKAAREATRQAQYEKQQMERQKKLYTEEKRKEIIANSGQEELKKNFGGKNDIVTPGLYTDTAVVIVDVQRDFLLQEGSGRCDSNSSHIPHFDPQNSEESKRDLQRWLEYFNNAVNYFSDQGALLIHLIDVHPENHISFNGVSFEQIRIIF